MSDPAYVLKFDWDNRVIVDETHGTCDDKYHARVLDPVGLGGGDTPQEAILSLCESLREAADDIEKKLVQEERHD